MNEKLLPPRGAGERLGVHYVTLERLRGMGRVIRTVILGSVRLPWKVFKGFC